jgi:hypothetical protein
MPTRIDLPVEVRHAVRPPAVPGQRERVGRLRRCSPRVHRAWWIVSRSSHVKVASRPRHVKSASAWTATCFGARSQVVPGAERDGGPARRSPAPCRRTSARGRRARSRAARGELRRRALDLAELDGGPELRRALRDGAREEVAPRRDPDELVGEERDRLRPRRQRDDLRVGPEEGADELELVEAPLDAAQEAGRRVVGRRGHDVVGAVRGAERGAVLVRAKAAQRAVARRGAKRMRSRVESALNPRARATLRPSLPFNARADEPPRFRTHAPRASFGR